MPPSDDDLLASALQTLTALNADLERALGPHPNPAHARGIAQQMREILASAGKTLGDERVQQIRAYLERAREKTLRIFGPSGWDEPPPFEAPTGSVLRVGRTPGGAPRLTDEDLLELEGRTKDLSGLEPAPQHDAEKLGAALSELRLLRLKEKARNVDHARVFLSDGGLPVRKERQAHAGDRDDNAELRRLRIAAPQLRRAAQALIAVCAPPENEADRKIRDEAIAVLSGFTSRSDEWLQRAISGAPTARVEPPLTDEDLQGIEEVLRADNAESGASEVPYVSARFALRLVGEIRRARSEE